MREKSHLDTLDYPRNPRCDWDQRVPTKEELLADLRLIAEPFVDFFRRLARLSTEWYGIFVCIGMLLVIGGIVACTGSDLRIR